MPCEFYTGTIENPFRPFSNGTEAMNWEYNNCERCSKAWYPKGDWPKESTMQNYVRMGKYCKLQYWLNVGWLEGTIPMEIAQQIGIDHEEQLKDQCMFFSDNDDDGFKYQKRTPPDKTPDNQLTMPFIFDELNIKKSEPCNLITT